MDLFVARLRTRLWLLPYSARVDVSPHICVYVYGNVCQRQVLTASYEICNMCTTESVEIEGIVSMHIPTHFTFTCVSSFTQFWLEKDGEAGRQNCNLYNMSAITYVATLT